MDDFYKRATPTAFVNYGNLKRNANPPAAAGARKLASPPDQVEGRLWAASTPSLRDYFSQPQSGDIFVAPCVSAGFAGFF